MSEERTNCPNCGAPISGYECDYCGTVFLDFCSINFSRPFYMRIKDISGKDITARVIATGADITAKPSFATYTTSSHGLMNYVHTGVDVDIDISFAVVGGEWKVVV